MISVTTPLNGPCQNLILRTVRLEYYEKTTFLTTLLLLACSSKKDETNPGQKFLTKYNGVTWEQINRNGIENEIAHGWIFYDTPPLLL